MKDGRAGKGAASKREVEGSSPVLYRYKRFFVLLDSETFL